MPPPDGLVVIGPNASLTERQAWLFLGACSLAGLGIASGFAALGYWPVVPLAGLELAAVGAALASAMRANRYREVVRLTATQVCVEVGRVGRGAERRITMPRGWTRVTVEAGERPTGATRLVLSCAGQRAELGRCLTDAERERLAARLRELLRAGDGAGAGGRPGREPPDELPLGD